MVPLVFKTSVGPIRSRVGSIPIRLRHLLRREAESSLMPKDVVLAMTKKTKIIAFCVLIVLGAALLAYGVFFHSTNVWPQQGGDSAALAKSEPALIKEASVGGVTRDESGKIKQTYTGKAPEACPT